MTRPVLVPANGGVPMMAATFQADGSALSAADEAAAFKAPASCSRGSSGAGIDPDTASFEPATIDTVRDLNGDGLPEAVIRAGGTYCYGSRARAFFWSASRPTDTGS